MNNKNKECNEEDMYCDEIIDENILDIGKKREFMSLKTINNETFDNITQLKFGSRIDKNGKKRKFFIISGKENRKGKGKTYENTKIFLDQIDKDSIKYYPYFRSD